ncbi:MAG: apolipoprotein N-acyltransferase [Nocardioides sp.]
MAHDAHARVTAAPGRALRAIVSVVAGLALAFSFEPYDVPVLLPIGVAGLVWSLHRTTARSGAWIGLLGGAAFMFVHLFWMRSVGYDAWLMLSLLETSFFAPLGAAVAVLTRLPGWPLWTAAAWVTVEQWRGGWPFGGMPWGRLAYGTTDTPFAFALPYAGSTGVSLLVALVGTCLAWAVIAGRHRPRVLAGVAAALVVATALPVLLPYDAPRDGTARVAAIQGDVPGDGTDILFDHRGVTRNHVEETERLADDVAAGRTQQPDFVVWPENATAIDPFLDPELNESITAAVSAVGVPILVGAIVEDPEPGKILNQGIVWNPGTGAADRYSKRHPVPYGEYIPWRDSNPLTSRFDELARVARDMQAGTRLEPLPIAGFRIADAICFDIVYDDGLYAQVERGAQLLVVQTSNATFIKTSQIDQQFEITRVRAMETGRDVVVAATNGVAGVIAADGTVVDRLAPQTQGYVEETVSLTDAVPPSIVAGRLLGWLLPVVALCALAVGLVAYRRRSGGGAASSASDHPSDEPVRQDAAR